MDFIAQDVGLLHTIDDLCKANGKLLQASLRSLDLLNDALHALRHDRNHITDEFIDRSINHLTTAVAESRKIIAS